MAVTSTLTVYDGRTALAHIDVHYVDKGKAEYRARLVSGKKLGTFPTQKAALDAIEQALKHARADAG